MADLIGQLLGVYRIIKKLGEGGFAEVYLAEHIHVENMFVAIKILKDTLPEKANKQFFKEAGTISLLRHPHIIRLLHCDLYNGQPYLVMDYIKEGSLRNRYPEGTILPLSTVVHYVKQIAAALQHAHVSGIVHRDIKPDNILWENDDALLVSDFGIATGSYTKGYGEQEKIGTLPYMAPEQFRAKAQSASDQYSLSVVVYEWLCGTPPFAEGDFFQMGYQHISVQPPPLHEKITIFPAIEEVVMKALAKEPKDRYENIAAFSTALEYAYNASLPGTEVEKAFVLSLPPSIPLPEYDAMRVAPPSPISMQQDNQQLPEDEENAAFLPFPLPPPPSGNQPPDDDDEDEGDVPGAYDDEEEELPPVAPVHMVVPVAPMPDDEDDTELPPPSNNQPPDDDDEQMVPLPPPPPPLHAVDVDEDLDNEGDVPGAYDDEEEEPHPVAPVPFVALTPDEELEDQETISPVPWWQSSGKRNEEEEPPSVAPVPLVAPVRPVPWRRSSGKYSLVGVPPLVSNTGNFPRKRRSRLQSLLFGMGAILLFSLLLYGGIVLAAPGTFSNTLGSIQKFGSNAVSDGTSTATVTIEPKSSLFSDTYLVTGIMLGTPDPAKRQVEARQLTFTTQPQSRTVPATGTVRTQGTRATGTLTFYNGNTSAYYVDANTVFTDAQGRQIANDALVAIPAGNPNTGYGHVTVSAHAVNVGSSGNIPAGDFGNMQCCGNSSVGISSNGAFSGGQDSQGYTAVQQSDVDNAANPLKAPLLQSALTSLNGQKHVNEQYVHEPLCTTNVTSNPAVGARATNVTVSVTAICSGEVYDQVGAEMIAANLLKAEADKDTGDNYTLTGNLVTSITSVTADSQGNLSILTKAQGVWVYQFDTTAKTNLAKLIAGKSQNDVTSSLLQQAGVSKVDSVNISDGGSILPTDYKQITIVVQPVTGLQGTPTTTPGSGSSTSTTKPPATTTVIPGS